LDGIIVVKLLGNPINQILDLLDWTIYYPGFFPDLSRIDFELLLKIPLK
jgi:hypothetical protein